MQGNENVNDFLLLLFLISAFHRIFFLFENKKKTERILCAHCTGIFVYTCEWLRTYIVILSLSLVSVCGTTCAHQITATTTTTNLSLKFEQKYSSNGQQQNISSETNESLTANGQCNDHTNTHIFMAVFLNDIDFVQRFHIHCAFMLLNEKDKNENV